MPSRLDPFFRGAIDAFHVACLRLGRAGGTGARTRRDRPDGTPGVFPRPGREELERSPDAAEWASGPQHEQVQEPVRRVERDPWSKKRRAPTAGSPVHDPMRARCPRLGSVAGRSHGVAAW